MIFERMGPFIEIKEYFEGNKKEILNALNDEFIGWVYMQNKGDKSMCNIYYVESYHNDGNQLHFSSSKMSKKIITMEDIDNHSDIVVTDYMTSGSEIFKEDIIYKLEEYGMKEEKEPVIKWWKKGKFESIKTYEDFNISNLFSKKKNPLIDIIDKNIKKSKDEFGLVIRKKDIELETIIIMSVFSQYDFKKSSQYSDSEYTILYRNILNEITDRLEPQLKYYFNNTPNGEVKSRYNCHIQAVVTDLMRNVTKMNEGIKWYSKGKLTLDPDSDINVPEYNDFITDDKFRQFLIDNNCYDEFIEYCEKKYNFDEVYKKHKRNIIDYSLDWHNTKSGANFWSKLDSKWEEISDKRK